MKSISGQKNNEKNIKNSVLLIRKSRELLQARESLPKDSTVGFVPTMGNLHQGHLSLLQEALKHHDCVFISIFVNPMQFGPKEDFGQYPRTLEEDIKKIEVLAREVNKSIFVFAPESVEEIYPAGFSTSISIGELSRKYCGKFRPGHFDGVTTVVYELFTLVGPHVAYFGKKDFQQTVVLKKMVHDLRMKVKIIALPTVRDSSGLALSSRNQYLSVREKEEALCLNRTLQKVVALLQGEKGSWEKAKAKVQNYISEVMSDPSWEYLEVCDAEGLSVPGPQSKKLVVLGAIKVGKTRLIDNLEGG